MIPSAGNTPTKKPPIPDAMPSKRARPPRRDGRATRVLQMNRIIAIEPTIKPVLNTHAKGDSLGIPSSEIMWFSME